MKSDSIVEYLGDYSYFLQKKQELESPVEEVVEMTATERKALQKEERNRIREKKKKRLELENLESEISQLETKIQTIDETLSNPEVSRDYEKVLELGIEREEISKELELLFEEWLLLH